MTYQSPKGTDVDTGISNIMYRAEDIIDGWKAIQDEAKKHGLKNSDTFETFVGLGRIGWTKGRVKVYLMMTSQHDWWIQIVTDSVDNKPFYSHQYKECVTRLIELLKQYRMM